MRELKAKIDKANHFYTKEKTTEARNCFLLSFNVLMDFPDEISNVRVESRNTCIIFIPI